MERLSSKTERSGKCEGLLWSEINNWGLSMGYKFMVEDFGRTSQKLFIWDEVSHPFVITRQFIYIFFFI